MPLCANWTSARTHLTPSNSTHHAGCAAPGVAAAPRGAQSSAQCGANVRSGGWVWSSRGDSPRDLRSHHAAGQPGQHRGCTPARSGRPAEQVRRRRRRPTRRLDTARRPRDWAPQRISPFSLRSDTPHPLPHPPHPLALPCRRKLALQAEAQRQLQEDNAWWRNAPRRGASANLVTAATPADYKRLISEAAHDRLVVVDYLKPSCAGCRRLMPKLEQVAAANPAALFVKVGAAAAPGEGPLGTSRQRQLQCRRVA